MEDAEPGARERSARARLAADQAWRRGQSDDLRHATAARSCRTPDPTTGACPEKPAAGGDWNPLTWVGLQKKAPTTLGPEPERESLIDPPKGYRAPAEGVGVKVPN